MANEEYDEIVRRCEVLETLIRKYADLTNYSPSEYDLNGLTYRQVPTISGVYTHDETDQMDLTKIEEKVLRQVLEYEHLNSLDWIDI